VKHAISVRAVLVALIAAAILPLSVVAALTLVIIERHERALLERGLRDTAQALAVAVDREFDTTVATLATLAHARSLRDANWPAFYEQTQAVAAEHPEWRTVFVVDATGQEILTLLRPLGTALPNLGGDEDVREALESARPYVSDLIVGQVSGQTVIRVHVPVVADGRVAYVLTATLPPDRLSSLLMSETDRPRALAAVFDRRRRIIARSVDTDQWAGHGPRPELAEAMDKAPSGFTVVPSLEGEPHYTAFTRVPDTGFSVAVGVPVSSARVVRRTLLGAAIGVSMALVAGVAAAALVARKIARPMGRLADAARALPAGAPVAPPEASGIREIDAVGLTMAEAAAALREQATERERRVQAEVERTRAQAAAAEAEAANRAKDEFLAMLGHELRNPLSAVVNAVGVLQRTGVGDGGHAARARDVIARQARHLARLVDDLLDVGRVTAGKVVLQRRPLDLGDFVRRYVAAQQAAGRTGSHELRVRAAPVWVTADETRLEQVLDNLLGNALKYTPGGGRVTLAVERAGDTAVLDVADTGTGIAAEVLPRVFDLFVQGARHADRSEGGLGIGLTLVRRLVELHGGTVNAASDGPGHGSTFTVHLPAIAPPVDAAPAPAAPPLVRRRVVLVEDSADGRAALRMLLELDGHEVHEAADGPGGVKAILDAHPDLALVDLGLPGLDGYEVARQVRRRPEARDCHLVALTGYGQPEDRERARAAGFDDFLVKPVDAERLAAVLFALR
jgi:signal transduction histidine kinase